MFLIYLDHGSQPAAVHQTSVKCVNVIITPALAISARRSTSNRIRHQAVSVMIASTIRRAFTAKSASRTFGVILKEALMIHTLANVTMLPELSI